ncbi:penicillin acylase family protein [Kordiimonas sp. SCSIO 12610]|uniref:penicillin acylase family protein n=1 Tax=Kordiimonas sp. SCSIO 12610 TaxID=2829597 RepID=UPI00210CAB39|nr:penicillin acylase family protein [Kordiimonas sp. SCSIO 12610]UTW55387.1 penicillin acylase family protein [Kordiimonas sp. SCSIO 12610]
MKQILILLGLLSLIGCSSEDGQKSAQSEEEARWEQYASNVTITRDKWGIPHIHGKTDADAVFGMIYAQAEDDFNRVELNYINALGRLAETEGEDEIYRDLRMKLFIDPEDMKQKYQESPEWLQKLMNAFADGMNYYLATHPEVKPKVIDRFEPWMPLAFSEGSIGGDIERVSLNRLENFYGNPPKALALETRHLFEEPTGSNGFAIAPSNSATGNALLLINPHTSFYFRAEVHMKSDEGLNAYGAVTWGQFFIYQGFNETAGWMHTSSGADAIDEYLETITEKEDGFYYQYGDTERKLTAKEITVPFSDADGMKEKTFTAYYSHHGPIIRNLDGKWVAVKLMQEPVKALMQSYGRTKAKNYAEFKETMELHTNSSNNTVFADAEGNIAYFHGNFIPRRDPKFNWSKPVDGSDPATEWQGLHTVDETVGVLNPATGWLQNTNNWPYSVIGEDSPKQGNFPAYMATFPENYRGINAVRVLKDKKGFTLDSLRDAAYDSYLAAFADLIPSLQSAYQNTDNSDPIKADMAAPMGMLDGWDYHFSYDSVPTSIAIYWAREMRNNALIPARNAEISVYEYMMTRTSHAEKLSALKKAVDTLEADFGSWQTPWGEINRFQRLTGDIVQPFDDGQPSYPVAFPSARWGSLAAYGQRTFNGTKKTYGTRGNSFVAVVEFGEKVRAKAVTAGGQSGDVNSPHFADQAELYAKGELRPVFFYSDDIMKNAEKTYHPGE